jgi:hypothetical protein
MFEMLIFIFGVYAFVFGRVRLPWNLSLVGWRARLAGLFLMVPLPILILLGQVVNQGVDREVAMPFYGIMEVVITLVGLLGAIFVAYLSRTKANPRSLDTEE